MQKNTLYLFIGLLIILPILAFFLGFYLKSTSCGPSSAAVNYQTAGNQVAIEKSGQQKLVAKLQEAEILPQSPDEISSFTGTIKDGSEDRLVVETDLRADDPLQDSLAETVTVLISGQTEFLKSVPLSSGEAQAFKLATLSDKNIPSELIPPDGLQKNFRLVEGAITDSRVGMKVRINCTNNIKGKTECEALSVEIL